MRVLAASEERRDSRDCSHDACYAYRYLPPVSFEKLIAKRTSIIIAHRLSTIRHANKILVLEKGEVREFGTHEELLQNENGRYRELYEMQFLHPVGE